MHIEVGKKIQTICLPSEFLLFFLASFHFLTICFVFSFCSVSYLSQSVSLLSFYLHLTQLMFYPACFSFTSSNESDEQNLSAPTMAVVPNCSLDLSLPFMFSFLEHRFEVTCHLQQTIHCTGFPKDALRIVSVMVIWKNKRYFNKFKLLMNISDSYHAK